MIFEAAFLVWRLRLSSIFEQRQQDTNRSMADRS
jgi:hypothetical protein